MLTVVRETGNETNAMANKPQDYKKEAAFRRENYRCLKRKYVTATKDEALPLMRTRPLGLRPPIL
ncbi:MAG: hypothetical protein FWE68_00180 [Defluviitaleaceae bacterium]|nr:hypothetical protein [Defluviitaleaceae bacterium]